MAMHMPEGKDSLLTCALLTRDAAPSVSMIHNRMPVVLPGAMFDSWLNPDVQQAEGVAAIVGRALVQFTHHRVSTELNTARTDAERLIEPA